MTDAAGAPGVLLDIDGTLLDSTYHHAMAWLRAFRSLGCATTAAQAHRAVGLGSDLLVPHLLGCDPDGVDADLAAALTEAHDEFFTQLTDEVVALPGARDLIAACTQRGRRVVLATSGKAADLDWMLPRIGFDVRNLIHGATTSDDVAVSKPAPDLLTTAMTNHDLDPQQTVAVGDSTWDGQAAHRAGVPFIGLLSGGFADAELRAAGATEVHQDPAALTEALDTSALNTSALNT